QAQPGCDSGLKSRTFQGRRELRLHPVKRQFTSDRLSLMVTLDLLMNLCALTTEHRRTLATVKFYGSGPAPKPPGTVILGAGRAHAAPSEIPLSWSVSPPLQTIRALAFRPMEETSSIWKEQTARRPVPIVDAYKPTITN